MTGFLLDTNVISEIAKENPDPQVITFLDHLKDGYISIITVHELYFGIHRLASGRRREALIGAAALVNGLTLATRDNRDFQGFGVPLYNPWNS